MGVFDKNIVEGTRHTATEFATFDCLEIQSDTHLPNLFGRIDSSYQYQWALPSFNHDKITKKNIDRVIDDMLTYIYYYVKLGINQIHMNKFEIDIPTTLFGITSSNYKNESCQNIINYVIDELTKREFECRHIISQNCIEISWRQKWCNMQHWHHMK